MGDPTGKCPLIKLIIHILLEKTELRTTTVKRIQKSPWVRDDLQNPSTIGSELRNDMSF